MSFLKVNPLGLTPNSPISELSCNRDSIAEVSGMCPRCGQPFISTDDGISDGGVVSHVCSRCGYVFSYQLGMEYMGYRSEDCIEADYEEVE